MARSKQLLRLWPLVFFALVAIAWWQRQYIYDEIKLYGYQPSSEIAQLASDSTMTASAQRVFFVNHPEQKQRSNFSTFCPAGTEQTVVLGCYRAPQRGIFLLDVTNAELAGIEQVTAAHEMLHAEYDRLGNSERTRIDGLLQTYFDNGLKDDEVRETIEGYRKSEPNDLVNEMHSIIGTEVGNLPSELESHYRQYFNDRSKLVAYYQTYAQAFSKRKDQIEAYDKQLVSQKAQIDSLEVTVKQDGNALQQQRSALNVQRNSSDIDSYNRGVASYNRAADTYNAKVGQLKSLINSYNTTVEKRNAIAFEEQTLVDSISAPTVPAQ